METIGDKAPAGRAAKDNLPSCFTLEADVNLGRPPVQDEVLLLLRYFTNSSQ
jgi:hypothetical protein